MFAYNTLTIPLAAARYITPVLAAAAMAFSTVFVGSNSLRLFRCHAAAYREPHGCTTAAAGQVAAGLGQAGTSI